MDKKMQQRPRDTIKPIEILTKVLVVGDSGVGKSSLLRRYLFNLFSQTWKATIGVDFGSKTVVWDKFTKVQLQFWDIGGQERFKNMTRVYYKDAGAAFIVFDVTRQSTLSGVDKWQDDINEKIQLPNGKLLPIILVANKTDLAPTWLDDNKVEMNKLVKEKGFAGWAATSAKDNEGIEEMINTLVQKILDNRDGVQHVSDSDILHVTEEDVDAVTETENKPDKRCCVVQ